MRNEEMKAGTDDREAPVGWPWKTGSNQKKK